MKPISHIMRAARLPVLFLLTGCAGFDYARNQRTQVDISFVDGLLERLVQQHNDGVYDALSQGPERLCQISYYEITDIRADLGDVVADIAFDSECGPGNYAFRFSR